MAGVLFLFPLLAIPIIVQDSLNKAWQKFPAADPPAGSGKASEAGQVPASGEVHLSDIAREDYRGSPVRWPIWPAGTFSLSSENGGQSSARRRK